MRAVSLVLINLVIMVILGRGSLGSFGFGTSIRCRRIAPLPAVPQSAQLVGTAHFVLFSELSPRTLWKESTRK